MLSWPQAASAQPQGTLSPAAAVTPDKWHQQISQANDNHTCQTTMSTIRHGLHCLKCILGKVHLPISINRPFTRVPAGDHFRYFRMAPGTVRQTLRSNSALPAKNVPDFPSNPLVSPSWKDGVVRLPKSPKPPVFTVWMSQTHGWMRRGSPLPWAGRGESEQGEHPADSFITLTLEFACSRRCHRPIGISHRPGDLASIWTRSSATGSVPGRLGREACCATFASQ